MGHPRDVCHAVSDGGDCPDGVVGDGSWDRDTYFRVNHGYATTAAWQAATGMTNPTRYEVYRWELSSSSLGTRAVGSLYSYKAPLCSPRGGVGPPAEADRGVTARSEEHTAELQSLIRHSYAVFCLEKKN